MEGLDPYGGIGCDLSEEEPAEMARCILQAPDLTCKVVLQNLNDPPIPFSEDDGSDTYLHHFFPLQGPLYSCGPRPGMPGLGSRLDRNEGDARPVSSVDTVAGPAARVGTVQRK